MKSTADKSSKQPKQFRESANFINENDEKRDGNEVGLLMESDYHDAMNAECYEKYFENVCKLLKPRSVIIIDNASYHSRNDENYPISTWRKAKYQEWLQKNNVTYGTDALRSELWLLCKRHRDAKSCKIIDKIAERNGHEVLRLPPYHCDLNAIELIWANEKNFVARENTEMTMKFAVELFRRRRDELTPEICKKCVDHVKEVENSYWKTDRIIDEKIDKLEFSLEDSDDDIMDEDDTDSEDELLE